MNEPRKNSPEDMDLEDAMRSFDLSHRSRVRQSLRRQVVQSARARSDPQQGARNMNARKWKPGLVLPLGLTVLLLLTALTVPPVNAMAQSLLRQIGQFVLVDRQLEEAPSPVQNDASQPTAEPPAFAPVEALDLKKASELAGFTGKETTQLPEGYTLVQRVVQAVSDGTSIYSVYRNGATNGLLTVTQAQYQPGAEAQEFWVGGTRVRDVPVRGQKGAWIEGVSMGVPVDGQGRAEIVKLNALLWEEGGFTFLMTTDTLSLDQMIATAEGIK